MSPNSLIRALALLAALTSVNAYWLMGAENFLTTERLDPIVNPGKISGHVHSVLGGSNFRFDTNTENLRKSECTSIPIPQDKSNYWFPHLYFQWGNGSFTSLTGGAVIYYLFSDTPGTTTAFPDDFRMLSGDPTLRTYDATSAAQQAITYLCLDFDGTTSRHNSLPLKSCPSGVRAQINFPSCWNGKDLDSTSHKAHVAFPSGGPDSGTCSDPKFPVTLPRIFIEVYWASHDLDQYRDQAMNKTQPFVYSYGDRTGYGYHADFLNGWDKGVLQNAVDKCHCNQYGDPTCCVNQGIFDMNQGKTCRITKSIDETTTGTLPKLPGNNPVQKEGVRASMFVETDPPAIISPVYVYTGDSPPAVGTVVHGNHGPGPSDPVQPSSSVGASATSAPGQGQTTPPSSSALVISASPISGSSPTVSSSSLAGVPSTAAASATSAGAVPGTHSTLTSSSGATAPAPSGTSGSPVLAGGSVPSSSGPAGHSSSAPGASHSSVPAPAATGGSPDHSPAGDPHSAGGSTGHSPAGDPHPSGSAGNHSSASDPRPSIPAGGSTGHSPAGDPHSSGSAGGSVGHSPAGDPYPSVPAGGSVGHPPADNPHPSVSATGSTSSAAPASAVRACRHRPKHRYEHHEQHSPARPARRHVRAYHETSRRFTTYHARAV